MTEPTYAQSSEWGIIDKDQPRATAAGFKIITNTLTLIDADSLARSKESFKIIPPGWRAGGEMIEH